MWTKLYIFRLSFAFNLLLTPFTKKYKILLTIQHQIKKTYLYKKFETGFSNNTHPHQFIIKYKSVIENRVTVIDRVEFLK